MAQVGGVPSHQLLHRHPEQDPAWRTLLARSFLRRMEQHGELSAAERAVLTGLATRARRLGARAPIVDEGERPGEACVLLEGQAFRYKTLPDGARQILSFHRAGDIIDLNSALLPLADHGSATLTPATVALLPHDALNAAIDAHAGIARAFWRETLVEGSIFRQWLLNIGRRDAYARIAHLLCETGLRSAVSGTGSLTRFDFPVTQADIADATALTSVHVNRTLQRLRANGLLTMTGRDVHIRDWDGLARAGGFDPAYLHLKAPLPA